MSRLTGIEIEWTPEQKKLIGQLSPESTGAVIAVRTDKPKLDGEFTDYALLNVLNETNTELLKNVGAGALANFESVLGIAMAW